MNWQEGVAVTVVLLGSLAGAFLVAQWPPSGSSSGRGYLTTPVYAAEKVYIPPLAGDASSEHAMGHFRRPYRHDDLRGRAALHPSLVEQPHHST